MTSEEDKIKRDFHQNNYNQKVGFFTQHLSRMWTRFNIFIVAETSIFGGKVFFSANPQNDQNDQNALIIIGLAVSVIWYIIGAQDKYLVNLYREQLKESFQAYQQACFGRPEIIGSTFAGEQSEIYHKKSSNHFIAWHSKNITTTSMASLVPLALIIIWICLFVINYIKS